MARRQPARTAARLRSVELRRGSPAERVLDSSDATLLDVVDNALTKGVVLSGDLTLALAQVDLIYARFSLLLCAADRVLPAPRAGVRRRRA